MAVITIARQFGAGGRTFGEHVADALGYVLVDEDIIEQVAAHAHVSTDWVKSLERDAGGSLQRWIEILNPMRKGYVERITAKRGFIDGHLYVKLLHEIIGRIAAAGNVVILGRGGQYILHDAPETVHCLMVAKVADRIRFMQEMYDLSRTYATQLVTRQGKVRSNLYKYFDRGDYDEARLYHLVLNMSRLSMDEAVGVVAALVSKQPA